TSASESSPTRDEKYTTPWVSSCSTWTAVTLTSSRRGSSMRSSSAATTSRTSSFTRAVRGYPRRPPHRRLQPMSALLKLEPIPDRPDDLGLREGPHEALPAVHHLGGVTRRGGDDGEAQLGPLPALLVPHLRGAHPEAVAGAVEHRPHRRPPVLEGPAVG